MPPDMLAPQIDPVIITLASPFPDSAEVMVGAAASSMPSPAMRSANHARARAGVSGTTSAPCKPLLPVELLLAALLLLVSVLVPLAAAELVALLPRAVMPAAAAVAATTSDARTIASLLLSP